MLRSTAPVLVGLAVLLTPLTARAECVEVSPRYAMGERTIELVFSGRVVETTRTAELGYRATFDVDRVWKGSVPKRFDVYVWQITGEVPSQLEFAAGRHVVVLAKRLTDPLQRAAVGLTGRDQLAFPAAPCSTGLIPAKFERDLGPGYPPAADGRASAQPPAGAPSCDLSADEVAIYGVMATHHMADSTRQVQVRASELIVRAETTEQATPRFPDRAGRSDWAHEAQPSTLASYRIANARPTSLSGCRLTFAVRYSYWKDEKRNPRVSPSRLYLEFSRVGFSGDGTEAFLYSGYVGGPEFGAGFLTILARTAIGWEIVETTPIWIS